MNILVVDDEYYIVKNLLQNIHWHDLGIDRAYPAYNAEQAKEIIRNDSIDIILLDIDMPRESGLQLIAEIHEQGYDPLVILFTGHSNFSYAQEAISLHVYQYLLKTLDLYELEDRIREAIQEANKRQLFKKQQATLDRMMEDSHSDDPIAVIRTFVMEHLAEPELNRTMIAQAVHMNLDYMSHLFSKKTGISLSNYIRDERMREVKRLLTRTEYSLQQIADRTGFSSLSYFHSTFRACCGMTPQQYRKSNEEEQRKSQ